MVSSLAAQLSRNVSSHSNILHERSRNKWPESYLFAGSSEQAQDVDLDTVYSLGTSGFSQLQALQPEFELCKEELFSEKARNLGGFGDRSLLTSERNKEIDRHIGMFMGLVSPYIMDNGAGKALEWLVRRFRIHSFNVEEVLKAFLPYHESPHFIKMLSLLNITEKSVWSFLLPFKSSATSPTRSMLVKRMQKDAEVARAIVSILQQAVLSGHRSVHRTLICFNTSIVLEFITRSEALDATTLAFILPAVMEPLKENAVKQINLRRDCILGSFVLLSALSHKCTFTPAAMKVIVTSMVNAGKDVESSQLLTALISTVGMQPNVLDDVFSDATVDALLRLKGIMKALGLSMNWKGVESVLRPLLTILIRRSSEETIASKLEEIVSLQHVPSMSIIFACQLLVQRIVTEELRGKAVNQQLHLLSVVQQRHPSAFEKSFSNLLQDDILDPDPEARRKMTDRLLLSLSLPSSPLQDSLKQNIVLASSDGDANVRSLAVRQMLQQLDEGSANSMDSELWASLNETLKLRLLQDNNADVLEAVYSKPDVLMPIFTEDGFFVALAQALATRDMPRSALRIHLRFICHTLFTHGSTHLPFNSSTSGPAANVLREVIISYMLFTKSRQKTAACVWEILNTSKMGEHKYLQGLASFDLQKSKTVEDMTVINQKIAHQLANNISTSDDLYGSLRWLSDCMKATEPSKRTMAYLIVRSLLTILTGERLLEVAFRVSESLPIDDRTWDGNAQLAFVDFKEETLEEELLKSVVTKSGSGISLLRLQMAVLMTLAAISRPSDVEVNWLGQTDHGSDTRSANFRQLVQTVYVRANANVAPPDLINAINRRLFTNLKADALLFLASIWARANTSTSKTDEAVQYAALRHTAAFLSAQPKTEPQDFQALLPFMICALSSQDLRIRQAVLDCILVLATQSKAPKAVGVFAYEQIYGPSTSLQYIEWVDYGVYLQFLVARKDELVYDAEYIVTAHQQILSSRRTDEKKDAKQKQRILCFLLSHVVACPIPENQKDLLASLRLVSNGVKSSSLLPLLRTLIEKHDEPKPNQTFNDLLALALDTFDASAARDLNAEGSASWPVYIDALRKSVQDGYRICWISTANQLRGGLFKALNQERQFEACSVLLDLGSSNDEMASLTKGLLKDLIMQPSLIVALIQSLLQSESGNGEPVIKKTRTDSPSNHDPFISLTLLAETLSTSSLPGSVELMSCFIESLGQVSSSNKSPADLGYVQQLLMTCIESTALAIKEPSTATPNAVRVDILVDVMRVASNPQTFSQALLLMSSLARLAKESVLHNVMPIFTFMGSNVFHRDDSYSFRVIQKTIENIVPVMSTSLKERFPTKVELYTGAREFLRVFTDASSHVPRHRRSQFYTHLVNVLGPDDFLAPVMMLLVDKAANKASRQSLEESSGILGLPLSLFPHHGLDVQEEAISSILAETKRLLSSIVDSQDGPLFLESSAGEDQSTSTASQRSRQCQALLAFVGHCAGQLKYPASQRSDSSKTHDITQALLSIAVIDPSKTPAPNDVGRICFAARWSLFKFLAIVSTSDFVTAILPIVQSKSQNDGIQCGALDLFADRIPKMTEKSRQIVSSDILEVVHSTLALLVPVHKESVIRSAFSALRSAIHTKCKEEESAYMTITPKVLAVIHDKHMHEGFAVLSALILKLGPRILPHLRRIVESCVNVLKDSTVGTEPTFDEAGNVVLALLKTLPSFWGSNEIDALLTLWVQDAPISSVQESKYGTIAKSLTKSVSGKHLLPAVCKAWSSIQNVQMNVQRGAHQIGLYFDILKSCIKSATKTDITDNIRALFELFCKAFDCRGHVQAQNITLVEDKMISAFIELVVKLNEATFQPLFRRLCDWAFGGSGTIERKITLCRLYTSLVTLFKGLVTPYMSLLIRPIAAVLVSFQENQCEDKELWLSTIAMLTNTFRHDEGVFWRDERLRNVSGPIVAQVPVCMRLKVQTGKDCLSEGLNALVDEVDDDMHIKMININILMHTRSEDPQVRILALTCSISIWQSHGPKLAGLASETAPFILECAEDEHEGVVREARKLKDVVEAQAGEIDGL